MQEVTLLARPAGMTCRCFSDITFFYLLSNLPIGDQLSQNVKD